MGFGHDLEKTTPLYFEMYICSEILHGMLHSDFIQLPLDEQLKWKLYTAMKAEKESYHHKKVLDDNTNKLRGNARGLKGKSRG